jgi:exosortase/archaeosortase family protein
LVVAVPAFVISGFIFLQYPARWLEARLADDLLHLVGAGRFLPVVSGSQILVVPPHHPAFWVDLLPSCSALPSVLTLFAIAAALPRRPGLDRPVWMAAVAAALMVVVGNMLRISASIAFGLLAGRTALVLFHNWAGSVFGFGYTLFGFAFMIWLLMPKTGRTEELGIESARSE